MSELILLAKYSFVGINMSRLLYAYGFMNVFRGMYYDSGMQSNNVAFLLQVDYLFS